VGVVRLSWEDGRGEARFAQARCIDASEGGLRIESPAAILPGVRIQLNADRIKLSGTGTIKHATRHGGKYILGVELTQRAGEKTTAALRELWALADPPASFSLDK